MIAFLLVLTTAVFPLSKTAASVNADNAAPTFIPSVKPTLYVKPLAGGIEIDGDLDDAGWKGAARAANFTETFPGDQVKPPVDTQVLITYDHSHLYIAFIAQDDPALVRSSLRARDEIFSDDYVGVILDTYDNASWAYELFVNPLGIQGDRRWTPNGEDVGFDVVFESRGRITEHGYQVEMAVPFKSLRFPNREKQSWRATFRRIHPRDSRSQYSWATVNRDDPCFPCQFGRLEGLDGVKPGSSIELLPAVVGSQASELENFGDPHSGFDDVVRDLDGSLGVRYGLTSSVGAEITINPDFSQVESDAEQIDVNTTFALEYPEKRPFFQEGSDLYRTWWNVIYTRSINDPSVAGKVTGRTDKTSFLFLAARDDNTPLVLPFEEQSILAAPGKSFSNIARVRRTIREEDFIGIVVTDRRYDGGGSGSLAGVDALYRFSQNYRLEAQALVSYTEEPDKPVLTEGYGEDTFDRGRHTVALDGEKYGGHGAYVSLKRAARHWNSDLSYWDSSPTFRAANGFVFRNSERRLVWHNIYAFYPNNRVFDEIRPNIKLTRRWNAFSIRKAQSIENWIDLKLKSQTNVTVGYDIYYERFGGVLFRDIPLFYAEVSSAFSDMVRFGVWVGLGDRIARYEDPPALGDGSHVDVWGTIKPIQRLVIEPVLAYSTLSRKDNGEEIFDGYILRTRVNYQFTRELFLRLVLQYDDFEGALDVEPLLSYEINPFTIFYVGANTNLQDYDHRSLVPLDRSGDGFEPTAWQWFFKLQYFYRL